MPAENPDRQNRGWRQRAASPTVASPAANDVDYPTVLVARDADGLDDHLVSLLQRNGFHVLDADDWTHVFDAVRVHSRPIHVLLADVCSHASVLILRKLRPELQIVFVKKLIQLDEVLAKVRELLGSPPSSIR